MPDVLMPRLSDTMTEGVVSQWLKREGEVVQRGDVLAEIETDKATMELEAYDSGVLTHIIAPAGSTVPIGEPIAVIGDAAEGTAPKPVGEQVTTPAPGALPPEAGPAPTSTSTIPIRATPLVRTLAREHGIDLAGVIGTGPGGRIVRKDIQAVIDRSAVTAKPDASTIVPRAIASDGDEQLPLSAIRRLTALRLTESAATPHFYLTVVADVGALQRLRAELNAEVSGTWAKISVTDLMLRACAVTLRTHPDVNSSWGGDHLVRHRHANIGCAVATDTGLLVPVIRDADRKSLSEISAEAHALVERARAGKLTPDEMTGGTFTISNLGMYGIDHFTAVINPPEAAILAVGAVQEEAVVRDGQLTAATRMKLTLSIDHRVLDGAMAAAFLEDLVKLVEHPVRILV